MKKTFFPDFTRIGDAFLPTLDRGRKREITVGFSSIVILFLLSTFPVFSQQQITENLKCTYIGNSFGGGPKWVQNFIENISVTPEGTVYTNSYWDEAHREFGVYTKCDVIGNSNRRPNSLVAVDCNGNTWTVRNKYLRFMHSAIAPVPTGALAPYISCSDGREIRSIIDPTAITVDNNCRLMVADNGPDQNIKVFDISGTGTPPVINTIGIVGGALGGAVPGETKPLGFWGIRGLGTDAEGNLWVAQCGFPTQVGGGTDLRRFNTSLEMDCQMLDLNFVASMDADPFDPTQIYSSGERLEIDYNTPAGDLQAHWKYKAQTLDPFKYPDDPRLLNSLESTFIRYIDGKKFMFLTNMYSEFLIVYRFDGEIAVPCAFFSVNWDGQWNKYTWQIDKRPVLPNVEGNRWLWRDNNGDGQVQKDEFTAYNLGYPFIFGLDVDINGNIYIGGRKLCYFPANGLDQNGVPNYTVTNMQRTDAPYTIGGGDMSRIKYVAETDVMYFGSGSGYPAFDQIIQFKNWSKGERNQRVLPIGRSAYTFTADDKYIYLNVGSGGVYTSTTGEVDIWDAETLEPVGYILPGAEVFGQSGMIDLPYGIQVTKLPGGERIIIIEEDAKGKNIIYKWCPDGNCVQPDFSIELTSPIPGMPKLNTGNVLFEASVNVGATPISKVEFYANNVKIGESVSSPYNFTWTNPTIGIHTVYAKAVGQNGLTNKSKYFGLKITDGKPEIYLQSPSATINYGMLDTIVFAATAQDFDGSIQKVEFFRNGTSIGEVSSAPYRLTWDNVQAGQFTIYARATDNDGNTSVTPTVTINVSNQYQIPFISPVKDTILTEGANFNVQLDIASLGGNFKSIAYYNGNNLLSTVSSAPYVHQATNSNSGLYNFSAVITLSDNRQIRSTGPSISVIPSVFDCDNTGLMNLDIWTGVEGTAVSTIPTGNIPSISRMIDIFEGPTNFGNSYGERISGYICPPQTGEYTFWTSGDDNNQLRIKLPDADTLRVIAYVNGITNVRGWDNMPSQKSSPIMLQQGQMYIIEGLLKEGTGSDHFAVGWQLPDGTLERPIPGNRLTPLYNPMTLKDDVSINIISPVEGAIISRYDSITIVAEVNNGLSDISNMMFYSSAIRMIGTKKAPESNRFTFRTKLNPGVYKLNAKGVYKEILNVPSNIVNITVKTIPSAVDDMYAESDFEVYPNPLSTGSLSIKLPLDAKQVSIYDVTGKLVYKEQVSRGEYLIDQSVFKSKGVYLVNVMTSKNSINKKVVVIK